MHCEDKNYRAWVQKNIETAPQIDFTKYKGMTIQPLPAFNGALVRLRACYKEKSISIYLDIDDSLGCMGRPYWEAYPYKYDEYEDTYREFMTDTEKFFNEVYEELKR